MKVTTTKSKNSESFYITKSYVNNEGKSTSKTIRKLGTLRELSEEQTDGAVHRRTGDSSGFFPFPW